MMEKKIILIIVIVVAVFAGFYSLRELSFRSYLNAAENLYKQNRTDEALSGYLFASALDESGSSDEMKVRRAEIFFESEEFDAAERELLPPARSNSKNYKIYEILGEVENARGNYSAADSYFEKACILNSDEGIFLMRVKNLVRSAEFDKAENILKSENGIRPNSEFDYYLELIRFNQTMDTPDFSAIKNNSHKSEIKILEDLFANDMSGKNPDYVAVAKADAFNKVGETDFAFADIQPVVKKNPSYADAWLTLGKTYMIENEYQKAAAALEKCTALDVNNKEAFLWLSGIYEKLGDSEKASAAKEKYEYLVR